MINPDLLELEHLVLTMASAPSRYSWHERQQIIEWQGILDDQGHLDPFEVQEIRDMAERVL